MSNYVTQVIHLDNGNSFEYVNYDGTWFTYGKNIQNEGWKYKENEKLWKVLSSLVHSGRRVRIWYGDTETGRSWNEEYEVTGTIGRSNGKIDGGVTGTYGDIIKNISGTIPENPIHFSFWHIMEIMKQCKVNKVHIESYTDRHINTCKVGNYTFVFMSCDK